MLRRRSVLATLTLASLSQIARAKGSPIRIGQIGTRHAHAAGKLATIRKFPELFELAGVAEPDSGQRSRVASQGAFQGISWVSEEELLAQPSVTTIAVETRVAELVPTALRCIRAGKHIHLDKPGGASLAAFSQLLDEAKSRALTIQMGYMFRYNPAFEFLFRAVQAGWLGPIREIHGGIGKLANAETRQSLGEFPGGGMFELGCHLIDAVVTILGKPQRVTPFQRPSCAADGVQDNQVAVLEFAGAIATLRCNHVDAFGGPRRQFHVSGEYGTIEIRPLEPPALTLMIDRAQGEFPKGTHQVSLPPPTGRYDGEFRDLAAVIRQRKPFGWSFEHDRTVHEAVLLAAGMPI